MLSKFKKLFNAKAYISIPFDLIDEFLTLNEISICCVDLMNNEYKKERESLKNFISLAILFKKNNIKGISKQKQKAKEQIDFFKKINIANALEQEVEKQKIIIKYTSN